MRSKGANMFKGKYVIVSLFFINAPLKKQIELLKSRFLTQGSSVNSDLRIKLTGLSLHRIA